MATSAEEARKAVQRTYTTLLKLLPISELTERLYSLQLISHERKCTFDDLTSRKEKTTYFLDEMLIPGLTVNYTRHFDEMIAMMKESDDDLTRFLVEKLMSTGSMTLPAAVSPESISPQALTVSRAAAITNDKGTKSLDLEEYREKFRENDVETSFLYMLSRLEDLWKTVKFSKLQNTCKRDGRLPDELKSSLESSDDLEQMFNFLSGSQFCNWLEIRILKCMAKVADIPEAINMLKIFEECVYSRKCSEVENHFKEKYINPNHFTIIVSKLNKDAKNMIVADLIEYCYKQESILQLPPDSITPLGSDSGCLIVRVIIPYCHYTYAYETAKSHFIKLRTLNTRYLRIGTCPKVYTTSLISTTQANSLLTELSSHNMWSHPLQVINHYYTYLEGHMDADSVSHMMHSDCLITDKDYEAITAAPNDININRLLLQYVRAMNVANLMRFCDLLKNIDTHRSIGDILETSFKSTECSEITVYQSEYLTSLPSKLLTSQFKDVSTIFLEVIDKLVAQMHPIDIEFLAYKCHTLMASDIHNIKLFTDNFVKKLFKCSNSNFLKIYLLPFNTWLDNTILRELTSTYENTDILKFFCKFSSIIDDTQSITLYPIPTFSQLIIPLNDSECTIIATKTFQNCSQLILKDVKDVKKILMSYWELTAHAVQLAAVDYCDNFIYWMIPKQIQQLVLSKLSTGLHELWHRGIFMVVLLPQDFLSADNDFNQMEINNPFNISRHLLNSSMEACQLKFEDIKSCANLLEKENSELKLQLRGVQAHNNVLQGYNHELKSRFEENQKQMENLEDYSKKLQIAFEIDKENSRLKMRLKVMQKVIIDFDKMKVHANILQEENSELKSQLVIAQKQLEISQVESEQYINKHMELKTKEDYNYAIETDMHSKISRNYSIEDKMKAYQENLKAYQSKCQSLQAEKESLKTEMRQLEWEISSLKQQLDSVSVSSRSSLLSHHKVVSLSCSSLPGVGLADKAKDMHKSDESDKSASKTTTTSYLSRIVSIIKVKRTSSSRHASPEPQDMMMSSYDKLPDDENYLTNVIYQGWLTKEGGQRKTLKKRWCILSSQCFFFFENKEDLKRPLGILYFTSDTEVTDSAKENWFEIFNKSRTHMISCKLDKSKSGYVRGNHASYHLQASSDDDKKKWIEAFRKVFENLK